MNSKKIEEIAVAAVRNEILRNDFLSDEIPVNDKTPSWDGEIWVYNNKKQKKNDLYGKVPVQVKGKKVIKLSKEDIKFQIKKDDLENYFSNGGILYFVIEIVNSDITQIFYLSLLPIDIKKILEEIKGQKSITKQFKKLPTANRALEFISRNFIHHSRKQSIPLISNIEVNEFDNYSTKIIVPSRDNLNEDLFEFDTYMYGHIEKFNLDIPLYKMDIQQIIEDTDLRIGINGSIIYDEVTRVIEREKVTLKFGKSFTIEFPKILESSDQVKIHFSEKGSIQDRIIDCSFMLQLVKHKKIDLNNNEVILNDFDKAEEFLTEIPIHIKYLEEISETFKQLGMAIEIDLKMLSKDDINKLEALRDTVLYKNYGTLNLKKENYFIHFLIGELKIVLICKEAKDGWLVFNLFDLDAINNNFKIMAVSEDKEHEVRHSPYILFEIPELFSMSNLNINAIEASLKQMEYENEFSFNLTNNFLLNLIRYYDQNKQKKEILDLTLNLYEYLSKLQPDNIFFFINKMQIIKRQREFTIEEKEEIINHKNEEQHTNEILCGFYILLDSKIEFEIQFDKLPEEQKEIFKAYPIYNLMEKGYSFPGQTL